MKVGVLTGGGDCPGLNAVIRAVVRTIHNGGGETIGLLEGWRGAIEGNFVHLAPEVTDGIIDRGGTILGSSRTNPYKQAEDVDRLVETFKRLEMDALIAIGGDDTLGVASKLFSDRGLATVGVPKTIDNDLSSTDVTFGFDTSHQHRDGGDRPPQDDRRIAPPHHGHRDDGPSRRLDRLLFGRRLGRRLHPGPGVGRRRQPHVRHPQETPRRGQTIRHHRRERGGQTPQRSRVRDPRRGDRRVRPRAVSAASAR